MKKKSVKLLENLSACPVKDEEIVLTSRMNTILQSEDYKELQNQASYQKVFSSILSRERLETYSIEELKEIKDTLPSISEFLQTLIYSLRNGNCSQLNEDDRPTFMNHQALEKLSVRIKEGSGRNYCNIDPSDCMEIFEKTTVKSIKNHFLELPLQCEDYEKAIAELLAGKKYCISEKEIQELEHSYKQQVDRFTAEAKKRKELTFRYKLSMVAFMLMFLMIPWIVGRFTGSMSSSAIWAATLGILIVSIICWRKR